MKKWMRRTGLGCIFALSSVWYFSSQARGSLPLTVSSIVPVFTSQDITPSESKFRISKPINPAQNITKNLFSSPRIVQSIVISPKVETLVNSSVTKEVAVNDADNARFDAIMEDAQKEEWHSLSMGELMQAIATQFLGAEYKAGMIDALPSETLLASLTQFDCVLFVETVLALARGVAIQDYSHATFTDHLEDQRYRNGELNGYCSRLHYFSEWIEDNQKRGNVSHLEEDLKEISLQKTLNFMSRHKDKYAPIVRNSSNSDCIVEMEANLKDISLNYIPANQIRNAYSSLQPGDIVGIATSIEGLDFTHTGLVYRSPDGNTGLIHASIAGEVKISRDLQSYITNIENTIGIVVVRPNDPRTINN